MQFGSQRLNAYRTYRKTEITPMANSSTSQTSTKATDVPAQVAGEHWYDLTATLSHDAREEFGDWLTDELESIELQLSHFSTPLSRQQIKSQRQ